MIVCEKCLAAITSHEGRQYERKVYADEICDENEIVTCEWCEEDWTVDDCPDMYEI